VPHSTVFWLSGTCRGWLVFAVCVATVSCFAQSQPKPSSRTSVNQKRFCQAAGGFCFSYPATWNVLGEAFGDGVIIAPRQTIEQSLWDVVTVASVVPPPDEGETATTVDEVITTALNNMRATGHNPVTLQRQGRTMAGLPSQMIKVRYHDDQTARDWIEQLVFIEGPDQEIYSASLKAQPIDVGRLEPAFESILRTWYLQTAEDSRDRSLGSTVSPSKPAQPPQSHP
jgi:hypothetical protein